jgi:hypothetical protein
VDDKGTIRGCLSCPHTNVFHNQSDYFGSSIDPVAGIAVFGSTFGLPKGIHQNIEKQ